MPVISVRFSSPRTIFQAKIFELTVQCFINYSVYEILSDRKIKL